MKILLKFFIICSLAICLQTNIQANEHHDKDSLNAGDYTFKLKHNGQKRMYQVHIPKNYNATKPTPMVLSLHGGGGNMEYQANDQFYGWISKSDQEGFIAVFPNGYSRLRSGKLATWNAGICCGKARDENVDDVGFIRAVVNDMKIHANVDSQRIFVNGMSNGGMMSYRLACEASDIFRAVASVTGTDGSQQCNPKRAVPVFHIHAKDDDRVLFNGGSGSQSNTHADFVSVADTTAKWVELNSCAPISKRVLEVQGAYCEVYSGCKDNAEVKLCVTETGGHSWPGGTKVRNKEKGSTAINATDLIWQFYSQY